MKCKKMIATALVAAMTATTLVGCGGSSDKEAATSNGANGDSVTNGADEDCVTINVTRACFNLANPDTAQVQKVQDAINDYIRDKIHVQINLTDIGSGVYSGNTNTSLAASEINLLWTASWEPTIGTNDLVQGNAVYDLTDIIKGTDLYNSMDEGQWEASQYDGKIYFVPVYKDNVEGYDLMFRKDLVDKYNWDVSSVKSLKDIEPMLADAKAEGLKYPYLTQKTAMFYRYYIDNFDFFTADATANWVAVDRNKNEVVDTILSDEYLEFCTLMAEWAEKGYISENDITKTTTDTTMMSKDWGVSWWTDLPFNDEAKSRYGQDLEIISVTDRWAHSTSALGSCYCVSANSTEEQAKACVDFLGLLYTDSKLADLYTFGIEGEDYSYNDEGLVVQNSEKYNHSMWESASATIVTPLEGEPANKADSYKDFNGGAQTSCAAGFRFDKSSVETQYAACKNVFNEYGYVLENGGFATSEVESKIQEYQKALDEAGYQDILTEFQKQYGEWKQAQ